MARSKPAKQAPYEPEEESLETPDSEVEDELDDEPEAASDTKSSKSLSKAGAAREAIRQGIESPQEASAYILERFGIDMAPQHFSAVKSQLRKKEREAEEAGLQLEAGRRGRRPLLDNYLAPPPKQHSSGVEAGLLEAMEVMKPLVASLGAEKVKRIVELLG